MEKFAIQNISRESITDESAQEFQVYSSHHMTRRHLVGMASIFRKDVYKFENGLAELVILPHSVYRISERSTMIITLVILAKIRKTSYHSSEIAVPCILIAAKLFLHSRIDCVIVILPRSCEEVTLISHLDIWYKIKKYGYSRLKSGYYIFFSKYTY